MQNFLNLGLNAGAQITHGGQVQRPRQKIVLLYVSPFICKDYSPRNPVKAQSFLSLWLNAGAQIGPGDQAQWPPSRHLTNLRGIRTQDH